MNKKLILFIAMLTMIMILSGCSNSASSEGMTNSTTGNNELISPESDSKENSGNQEETGTQGVSDYKSDYYAESGTISGATMVINYKQKWVEVGIYKNGEYWATYPAGQKPVGVSTGTLTRLEPNSFSGGPVDGNMTLEWDEDKVRVYVDLLDGNEPRVFNFEYDYSTD